MDHLEARVRRLERANLRLRSAAVGAAFAAGAAVFMGLSPRSEPPDLIRAKRFEVVNERGEVVATVGASDGAGSLAILDGQGHRLFAAGGSKDRHGGLDGAASVYGNDGHELVRLSVSDADVGNIRTFDGDGKELVKLATMTEDGVNKGCGAVIVADPTRQTLPGIFTTDRVRRR
jgi:hypothetical protein